MSQNTRVILDLEKTCRTCLAQKSSEELRSLLDNNLNSTISELTNLWLTLSASLPTNICLECVKYLNVAINFRKQVHYSESQLRSLILEEPDHMTVIYKTFTVLDSGIISEDCVANIDEIIGPQNDLKDNVLIVENGESDIQNVQDDEKNIVKNIFKDTENMYAITEEISNDNIETTNYLVTNEDDTSNSISTDKGAVNLTKSAIVLNSTLTNVIKWAESENNNYSQAIKVKRIVPEKQEAKIVVDNSDHCKNKLQKTSSRAKKKSGKKEQLKTKRIVNFSCDLCSKTFRFEFYYKVHLLKHGSSLGCELCLLLFEDSNSYLLHAKESHPDYKPFACPSCEEKFYSLTPLKMHFRSHEVEGLEKLKCDFCDKTFLHHYNLATHKKIHTDIDPYKCYVCHKKLGGSPSLRNHLKIHKGEKKHKCDICGACFIHRYSLTGHLRTHTGEKPFVCKICNCKYSTSSYLKIHMRTHTAEKPYQCAQCRKSFISRCSLAAHEKAHTGEKKFQCDFCGWRSTRLQDLQIHIRKHTGEKPYSCSHCGKSYKTASNLAVHRKTHSEQKKYVCTICCKALGDPRTLKSHMRIHTGETPYQCHVCGHRFRQSGQLSAHRKIHQNREATANT